MNSTVAVDSSVLIAILRKEPEEARFLTALNSADLIVGAPTILEARIWCLRRFDHHHVQWLNTFADTASVIPFDKGLERLAANAFAAFGKGLHPAGLNYGDSMAYAVATHYGAPLLFKGRDFGRTNVSVHPDSVILD